MIELLRKAGRVANRALKLAKKEIGEGVDAFELVNKIEKYILDSGAKLAFPVNISVNEIAAHYTPVKPGELVFKEGDVVKIDLGTHIDGWIADTAITVEVGTDNYKDLIEASKKALEEALEFINIGAKLSDIGKVIEETIKNYGFRPIYNLAGHKIERWILHAGISIPNFDNGSGKTIEEGIYAIEPFATNGIGYVVDGDPSNILIVKKFATPRDRIARMIYNFIKDNYRTLPFSKKWLYDVFGENKANYAINVMKKLGILYEFPILVEKGKGIVSQFEHTVYVGKAKFITTSE